MKECALNLNAHIEKIVFGSINLDTKILKSFPNSFTIKKCYTYGEFLDIFITDNHCRVYTVLK